MNINIHYYARAMTLHVSSKERILFQGGPQPIKEPYFAHMVHMHQSARRETELYVFGYRCTLRYIRFEYIRVRSNVTWFPKGEEF